MGKPRIGETLRTLCHHHFLINKMIKTLVFFALVALSFGEPEPEPVAAPAGDPKADPWLLDSIPTMVAIWLAARGERLELSLQLTLRLILTFSMEDTMEATLEDIMVDTILTTVMFLLAVRGERLVLSL